MDELMDLTGALNELQNDGDIAELANLDLSDFGEADVEINEPHFKVSTKELQNLLRVTKAVCSGAGKDIASKGICLQAEGDYVVAKSTDFDVYLTYKLDKLNEENVLTDPVVINANVLEKLSKALPAQCIILKKEEEGVENYYIRLYGGNFVLETIPIDVEKFTYKDEKEKIGSVDAQDVMAALRGLSGIASAAQSPTEKRVLCFKEAAFCSYLFSGIELKRPFVPCDFKTKDVAVLKALLNSNTEVLTAYSSKEGTVPRVTLEGAKFSYTFLVSESDNISPMKERIETTNYTSGVYVQWLTLFKLAELSSSLSYSTGKVMLNYSDDKALEFTLCTKKTNSLFRMSDGVEGDVKPLKESITIQASLLTLILRSFSDKTAVLIGLSDKGISISSDEYRALVATEG